MKNLGQRTDNKALVNKEDIAGDGSPEYITLSSSSGTLSNDDYNKLVSNKENCIIYNNMIFRLFGDSATQLSYAIVVGNEIREITITKSSQSYGYYRSILAKTDLSNTTTTEYTTNSTKTGADDRIISRYVSSDGLTEVETFASGKKRCRTRILYTSSYSWFTLPTNFTTEPTITITTKNYEQSGRFLYATIWNYRLNNGSSQIQVTAGVQNIVDTQWSYIYVTAEGK